MTKITVAQLELACAAQQGGKAQRFQAMPWANIPESDYKNYERLDMRAAFRAAGLEVEDAPPAERRSREYEELLVSGMDLTEDRHRAAIEACKRAGRVEQIYAPPAITDAFSALAAWLEDER